MEFKDKAKENNEMNISKDLNIFLELREIVNRFDPISLVKNGAPDNEHDDLTTALLELLCKESLDEIRDLLINCEDWYGYDPNDIKEEYRETYNQKIDRTHKEILNWYATKKNKN